MIDRFHVVIDDVPRFHNVICYAVLVTDRRGRHRAVPACYIARSLGEPGRRLSLAQSFSSTVAASNFLRRTCISIH